MSELEPLRECPFCGGEAKVGAFYDDLYFATCCNCGVDTKFYGTEAEAIEAWNTRYERTSEVTYGEYGCPHCGECDCVLYSTSGYCPTCGTRIKEDADAD